MKTIDCIVVLETERPEGSSIAERRIGFWQRTGFALNNYNYIQPPYGSSKSSVPLFLMTYPKKLSVEEFEKVRKNIHIIIYGLKKPLTKI